MSDGNTKTYEAWELPIRIFHWVNVLCVITLSILGLIMLNKGAIGISGREASIGLKVLHVSVGYVFALNLVIRIIWGFFDSHHSAWGNLIPGRNFIKELKSYKASVASGKPQTFVGHNPGGRLAVLVMLLLLTVMLVTGAIRAGTDIYFPPFGIFATSYISAEGVSPSEIKPYDKTGTDAEKLARLQAFKKPIGTIHIYGSYVLWFLILLHLVAVIRAEVRGEGTLISAMFSGKKHLPRKPEDL